MELHERWLADLRSEPMKDKLALAEGKITSEEYMENINKEIDLSELTIQEVYALRAQAKKEKNASLLSAIYLFLNGRSGGVRASLKSLLAQRQQYKEDLASGKITPAEHQKFVESIASAEREYTIYAQSGSSTGHNKRFIEAGKLIQGDEKVLVLVPNGSQEHLNAHSLKFWHLQDILNNAIFQEDPDSADIKDPSFALMDPSFEERFKEGGLIQQEIAKADIVLEISYLGDWTVVKTPHVELDGNFRWVLKFPEVTLNELLVNKPKDVWVYIDHRQVDTNKCENLYHAFARHMQELGYTDINLHLMSGPPTAEWKHGKEMILMASQNGFFVDSALQTPHTQKLITKKELIGHNDTVNPTLTSQCRTDRPKLDDHEAPGYAYTLSAQAEEARKQLRQDTSEVDLSAGFPKPGDQDESNH